MADTEIVISVNAHRSGPLFDMRAERAVRDYRDEIEKEIAQEGERRVHQELRRVLRHPTGYYQSRVLAEQRGTRWVVHDSRVVYGPWLEGTSSRNRSTRFKGYQVWRRMKASIVRDAPRIARSLAPRLMRRLG